MTDRDVPVFDALHVPPEALDVLMPYAGESRKFAPPSVDHLAEAAKAAMDR